MDKLIVTDTHFGCHGNSFTWLDHQLKVFYEQIIPAARKHSYTLIHCGDMFDNRSSINPYIYYRVDRLLKDLSDVFPEIYIIAGNHDYYSPVEDDYNINSLYMLHCPDNVHIISQDFHIVDDALLVPWYCWDRKDEMLSIMQNNHLNKIFCHTDMDEMGEEDLVRFKGIDIYSGHIHTPWDRGNLHNLGSLYNLTFADNNATRGYYILTDHLQYVPNESCIRYWRIYGDELLTFDTAQLKGPDYIEIYVDQDSMDDDRYKDMIHDYKENYNTTLIMDPRQYTSDNIDTTNYDISMICDQNIPEDLIDYYNIIKQQYQKREI